MSLSEGKRRHLNALSNDSGVIAAAAMDQRVRLKMALGAAMGIDRAAVTAGMMSEFKSAVTKVLAPHASAILLDPEYGLQASAARGPSTGFILSYERSGYDSTRPGRLPELLPNVSVRRIVDWGANAAKILLYYTPFEDAGINDIKHAFIERVGAECEAHRIPFFLELLGYDHAGADTKGMEYARAKPAVVSGSVAEFSKPQYYVDAFKVEVPINSAYLEGGVAFNGQRAYSKAEALDHFRAATEAASAPFIYLSGGVSNEQFVESLNLAAEAGTGYSGVLCGRATWKGGIQVYATDGIQALEDWLSKDGVSNITAVNEAVKTAKPWDS